MSTLAALAMMGVTTTSKREPGQGFGQAWQAFQAGDDDVFADWGLTRPERERALMDLEIAYRRATQKEPGNIVLRHEVRQ